MAKTREHGFVDVERTGKVFLKNPLRQGSWFHVRQTAYGNIEYLLGAPARTPDGWVTLSPDFHDSVRWNETLPAE